MDIMATQALIGVRHLRFGLFLYRPRKRETLLEIYRKVKFVEAFKAFKKLYSTVRKSVDRFSRARTVRKSTHFFCSGLIARFLNKRALVERLPIEKGLLTWICPTITLATSYTLKCVSTRVYS